MAGILLVIRCGEEWGLLRGFAVGEKIRGEWVGRKGKGGEEEGRGGEGDMRVYRGGGEREMHYR